MTVCEIVTHRIFVGLQHSRHLLGKPALWQHWLEVLDGLGGFVDLVPGRGPGQQSSGPGEADTFAFALPTPVAASARACTAAEQHDHGVRSQRVQQNTAAS